MKRNILKTAILFSVLTCLSYGKTYAQTQSKLVQMKNGKLEYTPYTDKGDIIPDFSGCGYMGGGVPIPDVPVAAIIQRPSGGDDHPRIQAVIDSVSRLQMKKDGFRGAILIKKGIYRISEPLKITTGGIVLRGEGDSKTNGTILLATSPKRYNVIEIGLNKDLTPIVASEQAITDDYVPSGSKVIHVENAGKVFKAGDNIVVHRPSTAAWIHVIGMDSIAPRPLKGETTYDSFLRYRTYGNKTELNGTKQWQPGSKDLLFERRIVSVEGDKVTLDIPVVNALQKEFGGARVYKYSFPERISNCGVENMYGVSLFDESVKQVYKNIGEYFCDENHANNFAFCYAVENAWVRNVSVEHFDCCVWTSRTSKFITGQSLSAINPISIITGGRRYAYSVWGQMCLFEHCYSSHHRHEFVLGASVAGPNAFVEGHGDMTFASSEPHQRWAAGCLYDNITIKGPDGSLLAVNRGWYGSGHGWSGAQIVFWNCSAPVIMAMQPPTAQNFAIGSNGLIKDQWAESGRESTIRAINGVSRSNFRYEGFQSVGDGWIEHADKAVTPGSLYYQQLKDRLGEKAVKMVRKKKKF
ncbi:pectate lyase [Dysgonomonas reticulitermitis]